MDKKIHRKKLRKKQKFVIKQCIYLIIFHILLGACFAFFHYQNRTLSPDDCMIVTGTPENVELKERSGKYGGDSYLKITINSETYSIRRNILNFHKNNSIEEIKEQNVLTLTIKKDSKTIVGLRSNTTVYCDLDTYESYCVGQRMALYILTALFWVIGISFFVVRIKFKV